MSELVGIARFGFQQGQVEEFKRLSALAMDIVRAKDTGTLQYDIFLNADETECMVVERYRDSQGLIDHIANLGDLLGQLMASGTVSGEVLGAVSPELEANLAGSGVRLFKPFLSI